MKYVLAFLFAAVVIFANYTATIILFDLGFIAVNLGTLVFGLVFTLRDKMHSDYGKAFVVQAIVATALLNFIAAFFGAFDIRIVVASVVAFVLSELTDTEVYQRNLSKSWAMRVLRSNSVSVPLDTALFLGMAFLGVWPTQLLISVFLGDVIIKWLTSLSIIWIRK